MEPRPPPARRERVDSEEKGNRLRYRSGLTPRHCQRTVCFPPWLYLSLSGDPWPSRRPIVGLAYWRDNLLSVLEGWRSRTPNLVCDGSRRSSIAPYCRIPSCCILLPAIGGVKLYICACWWERSYSVRTSRICWITLRQATTSKDATPCLTPFPMSTP